MSGTGKLHWLLPLVVVVWFGYLALGEGGLTWPPSLDFTGGTRLEYGINEADAIRKGLETSPERQEALQRIQEVFLFRLRGFDLSEVTVKPVGDDRLVVEVPGTEAIERVKNDIGNAAVLTFRLVIGGPFYEVDELSRIPEEFRENIFYYEREGAFLIVGRSLLTASDINYRGTKAEMSRPTIQEPKAEPYIRLMLKAGSKDAFAALSRQYYQKQLAICLDDVIISAPMISDRDIREPIITGDYSMTEAREFAKILRAGPLPVSLDLVSEVLISPSLGEASFRGALIALLVGICLITVLLGLAYADYLSMFLTFVICLLLEGGLLFIFGQMEWLTLSMVTVSGLVVLLGISVDNLILVFEEHRYIERETDKFGSGCVQTLREAFKRERSIVVLANITTIATIMPLYFLGGPITNLVEMMVLGVLTAVVVNVWFAQRLLGHPGFVNPLNDASPSHRPLLKVRFDIFSLKRPLSVLYVLTAVAAAALLVGRGVDLGLDFEGGTEIVLASDVGLGTDDVRMYATDYFGDECEVKRMRSAQTDSEGFQYVVRIPRMEQLIETTGASNEEAASLADNSPKSPQEFVNYLGYLKSTAIRIISIDHLGPTVVALNRSVVLICLAAGLVLLTIFVSVAYGAGSAFPVIAALVLDGLITVGAISLFEVPLSIPVIAATLTVIGYSINDSIVLCGHVHRHWKNLSQELRNTPDSILRQAKTKSDALLESTFKTVLKPLTPRVLFTSLTTTGVAAGLWIFGHGIIRDFGLVITVGTIMGTLSSISLVATLLKKTHKSELERSVAAELHRRQSISPPGRML